MSGSSWDAGIGLGWVMVCFAALCVLAIAFVRRFLPETKEVSVEETDQVFEQQAEAGAATRQPERIAA